MFEVCRARLALSVAALVASVSALAADPVRAPLVKGDVPPRYVGQQWSGADVLLESGAGKAYVISFWASWCAPCLQELPVLSNIQKIAGADKMQVIAVNVEDREMYRKLERHIVDLGLTAVYDPGHKSRDAYGVGPIPHMIIVGRDGRITSIRTGYAKSGLEELAGELNEALAADPGTPGGR